MIPLKVIELPHVFGDVAGQLTRLDTELAEVAPGTIVALPEQILNGYVSPRGDFDLRPFGQAIDGPLTQQLGDRARKHGIWLLAPLVEKDGEHFYNTTLVLDPNGKRIGNYRKRHPWYPETWATPGEAPHPLLRIGDLTVTIAVCFDVHFLRDEADAQLREADVLVFPSAWVEEDIDSRDTLLPALVADYDITIMNPNWGPGIPTFPTQGGSRILTSDSRGVR